jgi:HK97 family phage major capsid protein
MAVEGAPDDARELSRKMGRTSPTLHEVVKTLPADSPAWEMELRNPSGAPAQKAAGGLGDMFVQSEQYKAIADPDNRPHTWSSGPVDLSSGYSTKGTLLEAAGTAPTPPFYPAGVVETLFERPTVASLMGQAQTTSGVIKYPEETTATNAAAVVAQGVAKPESTIAFTERTVTADKIATFLPVADEMLEDAAQLQGYLNQRLSSFIASAEDTYLLGKLLNSGVSTYAGTGSGTAAVPSIFRAIQGARGSFFLEPTGLIVNPATWGSIVLATDTTGQYLGAGPYQSQPSSFWGLNVVQTTAIGAGSALFGPFKTVTTLFRRSGPVVEASNSHSDFFAKNLTALRAETRLAAAIYRPTALVKVTGI